MVTWVKRPAWVPVIVGAMTVGTSSRNYNVRPRHMRPGRLLESSTIMSVNTPAQKNSAQRSHALGERFFFLTDEERTFFKQQTGIQDDEELKAHILEVQAEAYKVCSSARRWQSVDHD